jgi:hypothetical protein
LPALFFYGTLCHLPLLEAVLGAAPGELSARLDCATLADHRVSWVKDEAYPMIEKLRGVSADGVLLKAVTEDEEARLSYYEGAFSYHLSDVTVGVGDGHETAVCFYPMSTDQTPGADWVLEGPQGT